jgi:hypothetical protein
VIDLAIPQKITRSSDHRYTYQGRTYPGVTTVLKVLDKSDALMNWAARQTAEAAVRLAEQDSDPDGNPNLYQASQLFDLITTVGPEGAIKALTARSGWKRDEAAQLGTDVHRYADAWVTKALEMDDVPAAFHKHVQGYADWWRASGWSLRTSEAMLVNPEYGYGGTLDLLARDADQRTVLADIKTGKGVYREAVLQLTAYGMASLIQTEAGVYSMPAVDRYVILHVTGDGVREIEVAVGALEQVAWGACLDLHQWAESQKGKRL